MKLHSRGGYKLLFSCSLLAALAHASPASAAEEVRLFPAPKPHGSSSVPKELPPIGGAASGNAIPVESASMEGGQPLRVVIPNIKERKQFQGNNTASAEPKKALGEALYAGAQDAWNNAVLIADKGQNFIIRTMFKPNLAFAPLPAQWEVSTPVVQQASVVQASAFEIASLAPAAGGDPAPAQPLVAQAPEKPVIIDNSKAPVIDNSPAPVVDNSEPAPALSTQSKSIAAKIPAVADKKPKETARKVDIARNKEVDGDVLNKGAAPNDAAGLKMASKGTTKLDTNYELERAYNALLAGQSSDAIRIYEDILTGDPKNKEALFGLASTYHRTGQIDTARTLYGKLLEIDPKHRDGLNNFLVLLADEAPQEALAQMERLEGQNPSFSPIPAQMAIIYQKLGDQDKAVDKMYRALSIAPENITYRYNLAIMLDRSGKYAEAGKLYSQILDAHAKGEVIPGDAAKIQQRLTFIRSNTRS